MLPVVASTMTINCTDCASRAPATCGDCAVSFICDRHHADPVVIDPAEARAVGLLAQVELLPPLRHRPLSC